MCAKCYLITVLCFLIINDVWHLFILLILAVCITFSVICPFISFVLFSYWLIDCQPRGMCLQFPQPRTETLALDQQGSPICPFFSWCIYIIYWSKDFFILSTNCCRLLCFSLLRIYDLSFYILYSIFLIKFFIIFYGKKHNMNSALTKLLMQYSTIIYAHYFTELSIYVTENSILITNNPFLQSLATTILLSSSKNMLNILWLESWSAAPSMTGLFCPV